MLANNIFYGFQKNNNKKILFVTLKNIKIEFT